jgi:hypothetical protein
LSFSSLDETSFLPFDTTRIVPEKTQVFQGGSGGDIKALNGFGNGRNASFTLSSETTSNYFNVDIEQAGVGGDSQRQKNAVSLRRL